MGKTSKKKPAKKVRAKTYEPKLKINGTFEDVIAASFKKDKKKEINK